MRRNIVVRLLRLHCYFVEETFYDDVYLKWNGKKVWPKKKRQQPISMDTITELNVELMDIEEGKEVVVELWDWDLLSPNDKLGTFQMPIGGEKGTFFTDMTRNTKETKKAKYTLEWEHFRRTR
jgi:hypothetical protein